MSTARCKKRWRNLPSRGVLHPLQKAGEESHGLFLSLSPLLLKWPYYYHWAMLIKTSLPRKRVVLCLCAQNTHILFLEQKCCANTHTLPVKYVDSQRSLKTGKNGKKEWTCREQAAESGEGQLRMHCSSVETWKKLEALELKWAKTLNLPRDERQK